MAQGLANYTHLQSPHTSLFSALSREVGPSPPPVHHHHPPPHGVLLGAQPQVLRSCGCKVWPPWILTRRGRGCGTGVVSVQSSSSKGGAAVRHKDGAPKSKGGKSQNGGKKRPEERRGEQRSNTQEKVVAMRNYAVDEVLLFPVVAAGKEAIQCIYSYPNTYSVGICSLGYQLVWAFLAGRGDVHVTRLFTDASEPPMRSPELVGFSLSWELDFVNLLGLLQDLDLPLRSEERGTDDPIVFGGGSVLTSNPEPYADFFDVVLLGDGENLLLDFLQAFSATRGCADRTERLIALAQVPGVYVPALYDVEYESAEGQVTAVRPNAEGVPATVSKQTYRGDSLASSMVVSKHMAWENIFMVEVVRSCPEMCRFCLASYVTLPFRSAPLQSSLIPSIARGLQYTDRLGLLGASVTQHPEFNDLIAHITKPEFDHVRLSIASVRTNTVTPELARALARRGTKSLTIAIESGSERVRKIVNKKLETGDILAAAVNAKEGGLESLKLYAMVGIPGEEEEDVEKTVELMAWLRKEVPGLRFTLGCSTFVPKAHTPFQWYGVSKRGDARLQVLEKAMRRLNVEFRPESYKWSLVQALLSRGDRRVSRLLERVREYGDSHGSFRRAFKELEGQLPPMEHYVHTQLTPGASVLPWSHLHGPLPESTLVKHAADAAKYF